MKCPRCSLENSAAARFCKGCGSKLGASSSRLCAGCGAPNKASASFCTSCGTRFAAAASSGWSTGAELGRDKAYVSLVIKPVSPQRGPAQATASAGQKSLAPTSTALSPQRIAVLVLGIGLMIGAAGVWLYGKRISETPRPATPLRSTSPAPAHPVEIAPAPALATHPRPEAAPPQTAEIEAPGVTSKPPLLADEPSKAPATVAPQAALRSEPPRQKVFSESPRTGTARAVNTQPRVSAPVRTSEADVASRELPYSDPPQTAPAPSRSTVAAADLCAAFRGLKLEQCRSCKGRNAIGKVICEESARMRYCSGKWGRTGDCPTQESFSQVSPP
jgi:hypothetical protein